MIKSIKDEFVGAQIEVMQSANRQLIGLKGKIVDETKSSFKVLVQKKGYSEFKIILKNNAIFKIDNLMVDGKKILKRGEDRVKAKTYI